MHSLWDYDKSTLAKTEEGRIKILERKINFGPDPDDKIELTKVRKYWDRLELFPLQKKLLELLIWGKYQSLPKNNKLSLTK